MCPNIVILILVCPEIDPSVPLFFEDDEDCASYYECSNGEAVHFICPPGTYFQINVGCDWAYNVNCEARPTTPSPEDVTESNFLK